MNAVNLLATLLTTSSFADNEHCLAVYGCYQSGNHFFAYSKCVPEKDLAWGLSHTQSGFLWGLN